MLFLPFLFFLFGSSSQADPLFLDLALNPNVTTLQVEIGSNLFFSSIDKATFLSKITLTNGNITKQLNTLLNSIDEYGYLAPWTLTDSNLTLVSTNDHNTTLQLNGIIYITTAEQAQDPNFHVVKVQSTKTFTIQPSSTVVFLPIQPVRNNSAPIYQPYRNTLITNIVQEENTMLRVYDYLPPSYYKDSTYKWVNLLFTNPIDLTKTEEDLSFVFFEHIEPMQFPQTLLYLTTEGLDNVTFTVSSDWQDQIVYNTTAVTTTGMIAYHYYEVNTTVNFQINPGNSRIVGLIANFDDLPADMDYIFSSATSNYVISFDREDDALADTYTAKLAATQLYGIPSSDDCGTFFIQYFGIDGSPLSTSAPSILLTTSQASTTMASTVQPSTTTTVKASTTAAQPSTSTVQSTTSTSTIQTTTSPTSTTTTPTTTTTTTTTISTTTSAVSSLDIPFLLCSFVFLLI